jgi:hypothetical protein
MGMKALHEGFTPPGWLIVIASAAALAVTATWGPARADNGPLADRPTWVSIEGAWDFLSGDAQGWADSGPGAVPTFSRATVRPDEGWHGKAGLVTPLGDTSYDLGVFVRYGETERETNDDGGNRASPINGVDEFIIFVNPPQSYATQKEEHFLADFTARRDLGLGDSGGTTVTGIAGVRLAHFDAQTDESFRSGGAFLLNKRTSRFYGAGPVVGFETSTPLGGALAFDFGADAALLLGDMYRKVESSANFPVLLANTDSHNFRVVPTVGASAAFSYMPAGTGGMKISLGVSADAWFGAYDQHVDRPVPGSQDANDEGETHADRFNISPFLRLVIPLN